MSPPNNLRTVQLPSFPGVVVLTGLTLAVGGWTVLIAAQTSDRRSSGTSEAEWIAYEITSELRRMPGVDRVRLTQEPAAIVDSHIHIWDPGAYVDVARKLISPSRHGSKGSADLLGTLTTPRVDIIERANHDISKRMIADPFSSSAHEDAARPDPPTDGVRVRRTGHRGAAAGFADEDTIVAVDDVWVHNYAQFALAWLMSPDADMSFLVFRDGKYFSVRAPLRHRWFSGSFVSYDWRQPILR